jgi:hypothetical protein
LRSNNLARTLLARRLRQEKYGMRFTLRITALAATVGLALACTTSSNEGATTAMDQGCEKACDEVYQACNETCNANVDNDMCEPECIAALRKCTDTCS